MEKKKSFLGTGWSFPPTFDQERAMPEMVSDEDDIKQSLRIILLTSMGERIMRPDFGSKLRESVFRKMNSVAVNTMKDNIKRAILEFEPRVTLDSIELNTADTLAGKLDIQLNYTVKAINIRSNIVFPYYFKEGTNVVDM